MNTDNQQIIYISGQITGNETKAPSQFEGAEIKFLKAGYLVVNPMKLAHNHDKSWESYMKEDIQALLRCDCIFMLSNWKKSRGARIEHNLAKELGMEIIYERGLFHKLKLMLNLLVGLPLLFTGAGVALHLLGIHNSFMQAVFNVFAFLLCVFSVFFWKFVFIYYGEFKKNLK